MSKDHNPATSDSQSALEVEAARKEPKAPPSTLNMVLQNLSGVFMSGSLAIGLYFFTNSVAVKLAQNPITSNNTLAVRVSTTVRTFLLALGTGATMIFAVVAVGIFLLTIQELIERSKTIDATQNPPGEKS
jgi:hypothetical protein